MINLIVFIEGNADSYWSKYFYCVLNGTGNSTKLVVVLIYQTSCFVTLETIRFSLCKIKVHYLLGCTRYAWPLDFNMK